MFISLEERELHIEYLIQNCTKYLHVDQAGPFMSVLKKMPHCVMQNGMRSMKEEE